MGSIIHSLTIFPCKDMKKTAEWYSLKMGFRAVPYTDVAEPHICLYRDNVEIVFTSSNGNKVIPNHINYGYGGDAYFVTENQVQLQKEFEENN